MISKSEELKKFEEALNADESLKEKYEAAIKKIAEEGGAKSDGEAMVKAAKELGFEISIDEMERLFAEIQELDVQELDEVAGGEEAVCNAVEYYKTTDNVDEYGNSGNCEVSWHCSFAFMHTETKSKVVTCFKNYLCRHINKD